MPIEPPADPPGDTPIPPPGPVKPGRNPQRPGACPFPQDPQDGCYLKPDGSGKRICGAWRTKAGGWCLGTPSRGMTRCRIHGGATPVGMASHPFKHGFFSRHMPTGPVAKTFKAALEDEDLIQLKEDVAVYNLHLAELFQRLGTNESGAAWEELKELSTQLSGSMSELDAAVRSGDQAMFNEAVAAVKAGVQALRRLVDGAQDRQNVWEEIHETQDGKAQKVSMEWHRQVDLKRMIPAEQAMSLILAIMHSVKRNVSDIRAQEKIALDISNFLNNVRAARGSGQARTVDPEAK
jgi:hypothetical protein